MRKLVESTFMTLDGVISSPQDWSPPYWDDEHAGYASKLLDAADALCWAARRTRASCRPGRLGRANSPIGSTACPSTSPRTR